MLQFAVRQKENKNKLLETFFNRKLLTKNLRLVF